MPNVISSMICNRIFFSTRHCLELGHTCTEDEWELECRGGRAGTQNLNAPRRKLAIHGSNSIVTSSISLFIACTTTMHFHYHSYHAQCSGKCSQVQKCARDLAPAFIQP